MFINPFLEKVVIPAKAGIQCFQGLWMPDQVRHDRRSEFIR
jgi:hypothetical protein